MNRFVGVTIGLFLVVAGFLSIRAQMGWLFWGLFVETFERLAIRDPLRFGLAVVAILGGLSLSIGETAIWDHERRAPDRDGGDR